MSNSFAQVALYSDRWRKELYDAIRNSGLSHEQACRVMPKVQTRLISDMPHKTYRQKIEMYKQLSENAAHYVSLALKELAQP